MSKYSKLQFDFMKKRTKYILRTGWPEKGKRNMDMKKKYEKIFADGCSWRNLKV